MRTVPIDMCLSMRTVPIDMCCTAKNKKRGKPLPTSLRSATLPKGEGKESSNTNLPGS